MISREEYRRFHDEMTALDRTGRWVEAEILGRALLARNPDQDLMQASILYRIAGCLMRQDQVEEALELSDKAMRLAHEYREVLFLVEILDLRAQLWYRAGDNPRALRSLQAAENYLREGMLDEPELAGGLIHTRGMIYASCGWWEAATENLKKAVQIFEHLRQWQEWGTAAHDLAAVALEQAESQAPHPLSLKNAIRLLDAACDQFKSTNNELMMVHARISSLMAQGALAAVHKDAAKLSGVLTEYRALFHRYSGEQGILMERSNEPLLMNWVGGWCRAGRAWASLNVAEQQRKALLDEQEVYLEQALGNAPRHAGLWCERADLHRCRAVWGLEDAESATFAAAMCLESVMDIWRHKSEGYTESRLRAGWLGSANHILESLAATAYCALHTVSPAQPEVAAEMISQAQFLRARQHDDLVRSLAHLKQMSRAEQAGIADLVARIRSLHLWLSWFSEKAHHDSAWPSRDLGVVLPAYTSDIAASRTSLKAEIIHRYPEYEELRDREQVKAKLNQLKAAFDRRVTESAFLRTRLDQVESEEPFTISDFQPGLLEGDIVLEYYVGPSEMYVGVFGRSNLQVLRVPVSSMLDLYDLSNKISDRAAECLRPAGSDLGMGSSPRNDSLAAAMQQFSAWLFPKELVALLLELNTHRLSIVASGPLWRVPFSWLDANGKLVLERWEVHLVPSVRLAGRIEQVDELKQAFAIGHPGQPYLRAVRREVHAVGDLLGCPVMFESQATPRRILDEVLPAADVIHFACHGSSDPISPLTSYLLLEPDEHHPDGRLMLYEILDIRLHAAVVNLGACHTAKSRGPVSFPESLAHALLGAGAKFVIASLWGATDSECFRFTRNFYANLEKIPDPVVAFREAQLEQVKRLQPREGQRNYNLLESKAFANMANFVLLSAEKMPSP